MSDLQRYFSGVGTAPPESEAGAGGAAGAAGVAGAARVELAAALAAPDVVSTASAPAHAARLTPLLPPATPGAAQDDVRTTLLSPQFAQVNLHV